MSDTPHVCEHGQLARSCNICDLLFEIKDLRTKLAAAEKVIEDAERVAALDLSASTNNYTDDFVDWLRKSIKQYREVTSE
jgi:hypothetical protein